MDALEPRAANLEESGPNEAAKRMDNLSESLEHGDLGGAKVVKLLLQTDCAYMY